MSLTVKAIRYKGKPSKEHLETSFEKEDFTIGRSTDKSYNHLYLHDPDRYISKIHAIITYKDGLYHFTDKSMNGTTILNKNRDVHRETVILTDGDQIKIGDYELRVQIFSNDVSQKASPFEMPSEISNESFFNSHQDPLNVQEFLDEGPFENRDDSQWSDDKDLKDIDFYKEDAKQSSVPGHQEVSPVHDAFIPPIISTDGDKTMEIPNDFNFEELFSDLEKPQKGQIERDSINQQEPIDQPNFDFSTREPGPPETEQEGETVDTPAYREIRTPSISNDSVRSNRALSKTTHDLILTFLKSAGVKECGFVKEESVSELMQNLGIVFRELVSGLMTILRARTELKSQFQVEVTTIRPHENNPLKFYPSVEETISQLLTNSQPGFINAKKAVREGYADIMNHQMAATAGVQAAILSLIERFDPKRIEKQCQEGVVFQKKAKYWDAFCQSYSEIAEKALEDFYGEVFRRAYEDQIRRLTDRDNDRKVEQGLDNASEE